MKFKRYILIILTLSLLLLMACKPGQDSGAKEHMEENKKIEKEDELPEDDILKQIRSMTLKEKLAQLIIVGFEGEGINEENLDYINNLKVGGFILFSRNIVDESQTIDLLNALKQANSNNDIALFLAVDEEGGRVSRLPDSFIKTPPAREVGNANSKLLSYELGRILGEMVGSLGFNINFAPVLDINSNPENPVIGDRAFATRSESVSQNGIEAMKGLRDIGIIPAVKHFPGHGDTSLDSHINLPIIDKEMEELKAQELIPFTRAIEENVEIIMMAHIIYPKIDKIYPATLSTRLIQDLLRDGLGYNGVIVSDDMTMGAIIENYAIEDAVLSFIEAGGDIALVCHGRENPGKVIKKLEWAVNSGRILETDIDEKIYRILKLKKGYNLKDATINNLNLEEINNKTKQFIYEIDKLNK